MSKGHHPDFAPTVMKLSTRRSRQCLSLMLIGTSMSGLSLTTKLKTHGEPRPCDLRFTSPIETSSCMDTHQGVHAAMICSMASPRQIRSNPMSVDSECTWHINPTKIQNSMLSDTSWTQMLQRTIQVMSNWMMAAIVALRT